VKVLHGRVVRNVTSVQEAAEILMSDDRPVHGPMCERAATTLIEALSGDATPNEARDAFRDAAREAKVLVE
jgi:hypothetical protein